MKHSMKTVAGEYPENHPLSFLYRQYSYSMTLVLKFRCSWLQPKWDLSFYGNSITKQDNQLYNRMTEYL